MIDLLYLEKDGNTPYCLIKNLCTFLSTSKNYAHLCRDCLQKLRTENTLDNHSKQCVNHKYCKIILPEALNAAAPKTNATLSFSNPHFCSRLPVVIYANFETANKKIATTQPSPDTSYNHPIFKQEIISMGYQIVSDHTNLISSQYIDYTGTDAAKVFI